MIQEIDGEKLAEFIVAVGNDFFTDTLTGLAGDYADEQAINEARYKALELDCIYPQGMPSSTREALRDLSAEGAAIWWLVRSEIVPQSNLKLRMGRQGGEV